MLRQIQALLYKNLALLRASIGVNATGLFVIPVGLFVLGVMLHSIMVISVYKNSTYAKERERVADRLSIKYRIQENMYEYLPTMCCKNYHKVYSNYDTFNQEEDRSMKTW